MAEEGDRRVFPAFPFKPYAIQLELMSALYAALQKGGVAIVESPTGTGKTLSMICSVLQWLEDHRAGFPRPDASAGDIDEPDWMRDFSTAKQCRKETLPSRVKPSKRNPGFFGVKNSDMKSNKQQLKSPAGEDDAEFLLDDYDSDEASGNGTAAKRKQAVLSSSSDSGSDGSEDEEEVPVKVFFCSRTHSQLSQFIGELRRTSFSSSMRVVSLGSRKTLCINEDVRKLGSASRINDRCLELQKKKTCLKVEGKHTKQKATGCPFIRKQKLQKQFKDAVLSSEPLDIEDLVQLGQKVGTCPYYGSRRSMRMADVVVLPYQSILHADTRETLGINLKDSVVIFDEAHNLVDTVTNTYSCHLTGLQLRQVTSQLSHYLERFKTRLAPSNRRYIQILLVLVEAFLRRLTTDNSKNISTINDFVFSLDIDNVNLFKLHRFIKDSNISNKVSSYGDKFLMQQAEDLRDKTCTSGGFHALADFILSLTTAQSDGRVLVIPSLDGGEDQLKFLMLDASKHFVEVDALPFATSDINHLLQVAKQARAIVLAGGTLQPVSELRDRLLFPPSDIDLHFFSCGHIVPGESILPLAIAKGPSGKMFEFNYQSRSSPEMIQELGRALVNICSVVPEGVVVFFPSFDYEAQVHKEWAGSGILASIQKKKRLFREPRNAAGVEAVLEEYRASIALGKEQHGAVLLSVVGGKMSEGINFSDGMGRCVVMVGLPYPSSTDPELIEKMKFIDQLGRPGDSLSQAEDVSSLQQCGPKAKEYYDNLCIKAVNQSIGRAIRHIDDYAAILLLDVRYTQESPRCAAAKLPEWIKDRLQVVKGSFGEGHKHLYRFFKQKREKRTPSFRKERMINDNCG